jgi:hypothetical protein
MAREDRSVEEPGRPGGVAGKTANALGKSITLGAAPAESDRHIARKRVMTVERRGLSREVFL